MKKTVGGEIHGQKKKKIDESTRKKTREKERVEGYILEKMPKVRNGISNVRLISPQKPHNF